MRNQFNCRYNVVLLLTFSLSITLFSCHASKNSITTLPDNSSLSPKNKNEIFTILDIDKLKKVEKEIEKGSDVYFTSYNFLLKEANEALNEGPFSVVNKTQTPPSGDKHDYISIGIYWWPDPSKLDGLPWIQKDGQVNPITSGDNLDLERKSNMIRNTYYLGLAHFFSGDKKYAEKANELLKVWFLNPETRMNPNLNYAQGVPGKADGRGIGIIEFIGITDIITTIELLEANNSMDIVTSQGLRVWLKEYLHWLQHSDNGIDESRAINNHGTWYDVQEVAILLFLDRIEEAKEVLEQVKNERIAIQIEKDGKQPLELKRTRSLHYSIYNLQAFTYLAHFGQKLNVDLWNFQPTNAGGIKDAYNFLYPYAKGEKKWTFKEISNLNEEIKSLKELFLMATSMFNNSNYNNVEYNLKRNSNITVLTYP
ncbi:alginate lyase family protein [Flavobacterium faecale]|uniref:alginate lyase family protein n=1 Tax=Flavobacterium faecale TaxID=1355330 RepID=UPI003AAC9A00